MKNAKIFFLLIIANLILSGCTINLNGATSSDFGGIFVSADKALTWRQKNLIPTVTGKPNSIGSLNVNQLVMDPSDKNALYYASTDSGLFYTYDAGNTWQGVTALGKISINSVAIDPQNKCTIYAASGNKLFRSTDCSRTWFQVYYDNDPAIAVSYVAVDHYNSERVLIGVSRGDVIQSVDRGGSWHVINRFKDKIGKIVFSPSDSRVIFVSTRTKGTFRTNDGGLNWEDLSKYLKDYKDSGKFRDLVVSKSENGLIMLATNYGILRSFDNGNNWENVELITPEKGATINAVALGSKTSNEIYYTTNTTFYSSSDGGKNWTPKKLPTGRAGYQILVDPENDKLIYMGVKAVQNQ